MTKVLLTFAAFSAIAIFQTFQLSFFNECPTSDEYLHCADKLEANPDYCTKNSPRSEHADARIRCAKTCMEHLKLTTDGVPDCTKGKCWLLPKVAIDKAFNGTDRSHLCGRLMQVKKDPPFCSITRSAINCAATCQTQTCADDF